MVPTGEQRQLLKDTLYQANQAANEVSGVAWAAKCFRAFAIHKLVYKEVRQRYGLSAQMTVRVIGKVADAYKAGKKGELGFKKLGAIAYDSRIVVANGGTADIDMDDGGTATDAIPRW